ncbi:hypothetical protein ACHAXR_010848 [Thalassiosira sp. AJA248-18]
MAPSMSTDNTALNATTATDASTADEAVVADNDADGTAPTMTTPTAGAIAGAAAANNSSPLQPFISSLKAYIIDQIGTRLGSSAMAIPGLYGAAVREFPFLADVDWEAEGEARMGRLQRRCNQEGIDSSGEKKKKKKKKSSPTKTITTMSASSAKKASSAGGRAIATKPTRSSKRAKELATDKTDGSIDYSGSKYEDTLNVPLPPLGEATTENLGQNNAATAGISTARQRALATTATTTIPSPARKRKAPPPPDQSSDSEESYRQTDSNSDSEQKLPQKKETVHRKQRGMKTFEQRLEQCILFKQQNDGILNIPNRNDLPISMPDNNNIDDFEGLTMWAQARRGEYQSFFDGAFDETVRDIKRRGPKPSKGTVSNRLEILEEIGFVFETTTNTAAAAGGGDMTSSLAVANAEQGQYGGATAPPRSIWGWRHSELVQFKAENGHLNIHSNHKLHGVWVDRMRSLYKRDKVGVGKKKSKSQQQQHHQQPLSIVEKNKIQQLESLGFAFDRAFDVNLQKLAAFKATTGHCKVPIKWKSDRALGSWAEMVRREHNKSNRVGETSEYLTADRLRKLATVGFVFQVKPKEVPWETRFERLRQYREEHDGQDPPISHKELGSWMQKMRQYYNIKMDGNGKKHYLTDEREEKLHSIGFVFQKGKRPDATELTLRQKGRKISWDDRLAEFVQWKERHGHPYVPTVTEGEEKQLGRWVAKQRQAYKAYQGGGSSAVKNKDCKSKYGVLTAEKALKLANAGFAFDASHIHKTPKNNDNAVDAEMEEEETGNIGPFGDGSAAGNHEEEDVATGAGAAAEWGSYETYEQPQGSFKWSQIRAPKATAAISAKGEEGYTPNAVTPKEDTSLRNKRNVKRRVAHKKTENPVLTSPVVAASVRTTRHCAKCKNSDEDDTDDDDSDTDYEP